MYIGGFEFFICGIVIFDFCFVVYQFIICFLDISILVGCGDDENVDSGVFCGGFIFCVLFNVEQG